MKKNSYFNYLMVGFFLLFSLPFLSNAQTTPWYVGGNTIRSLSPFPYLGTLDRFPICFITNNQPRMTILAEEKIGIGTVLPKTQLHLHSNSNYNSFLVTNTTIGDAGNRGFIVRQEGGEITLQQQEKGVFNLFGLQNSGMTIVSNGYVGFGTAIPRQKIHVVGENILISKTSTRAPGSTNGSLLFGADINSQNDYGVWGIEYLNSNTDGYGLNFWKTWNNASGFNYALFLADNGKVGIGTPSPQRKLDIIGDVGATGLFVNHTATGDWGFAAQITVNRDLTKALSITHITRGEVFRIYGSGIVNAKKIYAEAFEIHSNAMGISWYDHVFAQDYNLRPLSELEQFIKTNQHLPEIPSEMEVNENGINLGEMQGKLLMKIEELTLYIIEQEKQLKELQNRISELENKKGGE